MDLEKYCSGKLRFLRPIMHEWFNVIETYQEFTDYADCQWWYNERVTLSSFAAAIWKSEGAALEEYATTKGKKRSIYRGRGDLYFCFDKHEFGCEAKQIWCSFGKRSKQNFAIIDSQLGKACNEANSLNEEFRRLGVCFVVPYIPEAEKDQIDKQLMNWLKGLKTVNKDFISWTFPEKTRETLLGYDGNLYPGVVILIREAGQL